MTITAHEIMVAKASQEKQSVLDRIKKFRQIFEQSSSRICSYVILYKDKPGMAGIVKARTTDHALTVLANLPGDLLHHSRAGGWGYNRMDAAMSGALFQKPNGEWTKILDNGFSWEQQLREAGYDVRQAV